MPSHPVMVFKKIEEFDSLTMKPSGTCEMVQWIKVSAQNLNNLTLISRTCTVKGEN